MPRVVPSQAVSLIDEFFPNAQKSIPDNDVHIGAECAPDITGNCLADATPLMRLPCGAKQIIACKLDR